MSTATRGRALEHQIRTLFRNDGWEAFRGAGSKGEFAEMKPDLVMTKHTTKLLRRAGIKFGYYIELDEHGNLDVFDVVSVQAKLEKEKA
jgi:Holliday junction resolvase